MNRLLCKLFGHRFDWRAYSAALHADFYQCVRCSFAKTELRAPLGYWGCSCTERPCCHE